MKIYPCAIGDNKETKTTFEGNRQKEKPKDNRTEAVTSPIKPAAASFNLIIQ